jgi:hypothetical protein
MSGSKEEGIMTPKLAQLAEALSATGLPVGEETQEIGR